MTQRAPAAGTVTIDPAAIAANTRLLTDRARGELMAVVKADGFGHGSVEVGTAALANGATRLGVTCLAEALPLRDAGLTAPILSWLDGPGADFSAAVTHDIEVAVPDQAHLDAIAHRAMGARVHLHLDLGLARDGAAPEHWPALCRAAHRLERQGVLRVVGLMGHLPCADDPAHPSNALGRARFDRGRFAVPGQLTVDLHPFFRNDRAIDSAVRAAIFRAAREQIEVVEIVCGKGSGVLRKRVLAMLGQPHLRKLYRKVDVSGDNEGRILVRF